MSRYLLKRELSIEELTIVILIWIPSIMASFVLLSNSEIDLSVAECAGIITVYLVGSSLNTFSELQRKIWKEGKHAATNKGRVTKVGYLVWVGTSTTLVTVYYSVPGQRLQVLTRMHGYQSLCHYHSGFIIFLIKRSILQRGTGVIGMIMCKRRLAALFLL